MKRGQDKTKKLSPRQEETQDLEKTYMDKLSSFLQGNNFQSRLLFMEEYLQEAIKEDGLKDWGKTPIDDTLEEIFKFCILSEWKDDILNIYPNPKSGDIALIMEDCIISIDCKTLSWVGNHGDFTDLIYSPNQISFHNKEYGRIPLEARLKKIENIKSLNQDFPVLSFFVGVHYTCNEKGSYKGFKLYNNDEYEVISLVCMPNGELEDLFDRDLVYNVKFFPELGKTEQDSLGIKTLKMINAKEYKRMENAGEKFPHLNLDGSEDLKNLLEKYLPNFKFDKADIFEHSKKRYGVVVKNIPYKPSKSTTGGKSPEVILKPCRADGPRILKTSLKNRWDGNGVKWIGYKQIKLNRK